MSLTGTLFFFLLIAVTGVAVLGTLVAWGHVRGPKPLRWLSRTAMIVACQVTAIAVVAVWINNSYGLYTSWNDLLGLNGGAPTVNTAGPPIGQAMFSRGNDDMLHTVYHGARSGLSAPVMVWTPPQYNDPANSREKFPVIVLLHGTPGSPESWVDGAGFPGTIAKMMEAGLVKPAIVVLPTINPGGVDTDCSDTPARKNATWLAQDVPQLIRSQFRALPEATAWGLLGYSTGGLCAIKLPMQYPKVFASGAGLDPDDLDGDAQVLKDPVLRERNSPIWLARERPDVSLFLATSAQDRFSKVDKITELRRAVKWPTVVAPPLVLPTGGHSWTTWGRMYPTAFSWLSTHLDAAHVPKQPKPKVDAAARVTPFPMSRNGGQPSPWSPARRETAAQPTG